MKMKTRWALVAALLAAGAATLYFFTGSAPSSPAAEQRGGAGRAVPVSAEHARRGDIEVLINALGTVTARNTVLIKPRVDGLLQRVAFQEGQQVKVGEVVAEIDARPYRAQLEQASGQLARDQALLANAQLDVTRYRDLQAKDSIAQQQVDAQEALVRQYQGVVQTDRGAVESARLQLDFTQIRAPISGRLGLRQVDVGNMVHASDSTGIFVLTQTRPITVVFAIPADQLAAVLPRVQAGEKLRVDAWDREGKAKLASGRLLTLDNQIDTATGTVKLKAEFDNNDDALFPNLFVNVRLRAETRSGAILVPIAAISRGAQGTFVYVVDSQTRKVSTRSVTLGPSTADVTAIEKGLEAGELVVFDGADKLRQGSLVEFSAPRSSGDPSGAQGSGRQRRADGAPAAKNRE